MVNFIHTNVLSQFGFSRDQSSLHPLGNGHINQTFLVTDKSKSMVLQRINTQIFTNPKIIIQNAVTISQHLLTKRQQQQYPLQVVSPIATVSGALYLDLGEQGFWRAIDYLPHSDTIEVVNSAEQAMLAAEAFGHFAAALSDLTPDDIIDVIPNFLNLPQRIFQLQDAKINNTQNRLVHCEKWVDLCLAQSDILTMLAQYEAELPIRICHNDTKINNMLFDKRDMSSLAIIDLDTCMKGYLMYDFGDMVRAFCSPEAEDSTHLASVHARPEIIIAAANAYIKPLVGIITPLEKRSLWLGTKVMPLMLGVRFLTDYLNGDVYFGIKYQNHNLDRAINQLTIYQSLQQQETALRPLFDA
ncbi:phosphotransferase enzyme family protein [Shewanella livingstonensis]|uniref:Aminoglycoside phosphotransferase family protein n=1 Tax=Shewanella livingstonensis TaxID=150120 RepID=A0A3G8LQN1_9GAMM|nr:aminoglycoside phosphotransferase family protein [Shewanella livingstonensis]AZG71871.1 aminoglycoside phosphotransferase family protein [Shewanella livingstonensis]